MATINIRIIGCGDAFNSGGKLHTCFYVESAGTHLLIDCGATAYHGIKQQGINVRDIDLILISHFHGDHYGGVPFLLLEEAIQRREKPLTIISPPTGKERIAQLLHQLYPGTDVIGKLNLRFYEYESGNGIGTHGLQVRALPVIHSPDVLPHGMRIAMGGKIIAYSGDTEWTPALIDLARGADLFICECNFYKSEIAGHMTYRTLEANDDQLAYKRIILTHLGPEMFENQGRVIHPCAEDGLEIRL